VPACTGFGGFLIVLNRSDRPQGVHLVDVKYRFNLNDAPNLRAKLEQAGLDPATYLSALPRLSASR
jgi:hypothetical protein